MFVVSGTHVGNVDGQLQARPSGPGQLHLCLNRGSEVFAVTADGLSRVWRREATPTEEGCLDKGAAATVEALHRRGIAARIVSERLNRRKIDLIPEPAWADPPKARIAELLTAVTERLQRAGIGDLAQVVAIAAEPTATASVAEHANRSTPAASRGARNKRCGPIEASAANQPNQVKEQGT